MINILFYDFECFKKYTVVCLENLDGDKFCFDNARKLQEFLDAEIRREKLFLMVGFNNVHYDMHILEAFLKNQDCYLISQEIIQNNRNGWECGLKGINKKYPQYDVMSAFGLARPSLKSLESQMGINIQETTVPFDLERELTDDEKNEVIYYCFNDVSATKAVFEQTIAEFKAKLGLINTFKLPFHFISKTNAQLSAEILGCKRRENADADEWDVSIIDSIDVGRYSFCRDWFQDLCFAKQQDEDFPEKLETRIGGIPTVLALGGLHGAIDHPYYYRKSNGMLIYHVDVGSFYPNLMIQHNLLTRSSTKPELYKQIYETRMALKKAGKKKEQAPYKIVLNGTYGICMAKFNKAYDPRRAREIPINGQLMLIDLIDKLEAIGGVQLIQSNTDGLIIRFHEIIYDWVMGVCHEWCYRNKMNLEYDAIDWICQKDVNNYIFQFTNGKLEKKGKMLKDMTPLDNDCAILNECLTMALCGEDWEKHLYNENNPLWKYQKTIKKSSKYDYLIVDDKVLTDVKTCRVFPTNNGYSVFKQKLGKNPENFAGTLGYLWTSDNGDITAKTVADLPELDFDYYVDEIDKRLEMFNYGNIADI